MKRNYTILFLCSFVLLTFRMNAQDYAASVKLSTLGVNVEAYRSFSPSFNARLGFSMFNYTYESGVITGEDYKYDAKLNLFSVSALGDWFPFQSTSLRLTGGLIINLNKPEVTAIPTIEKKIGGDVYNADNLGTVGIDLTFNKIAPYIGLGIGNPTSGEKGFGFTFDLGTCYQGSPKVKLDAEGLLAPSASPEQEAIVEKNLNWFKFYPVLSIGLSYKF